MRETALLKNLFDHLCFMLHRPYFFKSKTLIITTTGGIGANSSAKSIRATLSGIGFNKCYMFPQSSYSWNDYKPSQSTIKSLSKVTQKFYKDVESKKIHSPSFLKIIPYNLFRGMSPHYVKGCEFPTIDGDHWTEKIQFMIAL